MSFWARLGVEIKDLKVLAKVCEEFGLTYTEYTGLSPKGEKAVAVIQSKSAGVNATGRGYVIYGKSGGYSIEMDRDVNYSILAKETSGGDRLARNYTRDVIRKGIDQNGGFVESINELPDGSLVIKAYAA